MSTIAPPPWLVARSKTSELPSSTPVALAVAGADALYSISTIGGVAFFAGYNIAGGGRTGAIVGLATLPVVAVALWAFGTWYTTNRADSLGTIESVPFPAPAPAAPPPPKP